MKTFAPLFAIFLFLIARTCPAQYSAIVIDADNGKVLHQVDATQPWFPASLTKVMTVYLTFQALKSGSLNLQDTLQVSTYAAQQPNSKIGLEAGESLSVREAILAVLTRSANDAAVALAERIGGTEAKFANKMTEMARKLRMNTTAFYNATGLPHAKQITTSRDLALLAKHVRQDFKEYFSYFSNPAIDYKGRHLPNINSFLYAYPGAEGMKTGFTCASGYNLMAAVNRKGKHLLGVVLGATTREERNHLMTSIIDQGLAASQSQLKIESPEFEAAEAADRPVYQLPAETCKYDDYSGFSRLSKLIPHIPHKKSAVASSFSNSHSPTPSVEDKNSLKGWSVILGAFETKQEADSLSQSVEASLDRKSRQGHGLVLEREMEGMNLWHTYWTDLQDETVASNFCKNLWEIDIECNVLMPESFSDNEAL